MYMKPNNAGKNKWLRAQTLNQKLKNAQTQDADGGQAFFCVIYDTVRGHTSTLLVLIGSSEILSLYVLAEAPAKRCAALQSENCLTSPVARTLWSVFNNFTL